MFHSRSRTTICFQRSLNRIHSSSNNRWRIEDKKKVFMCVYERRLTTESKKHCEMKIKVFLHVFVFVLCLSLSFFVIQTHTLLVILSLCQAFAKWCWNAKMLPAFDFSRWQFTFWHDKKHAANQFECTRTHTQTNKHWHIELRSKRMNAVERQKFAQHLSKFKLSALVWIISQNWKYYIISIVHT